MEISPDMIGCRMQYHYGGSDIDDLGIIVGAYKPSSGCGFVILEDNGDIRFCDTSSYNFRIHPEDLPILKMNIKRRMRTRARMEDQETTRAELMDLEG